VTGSVHGADLDVCTTLAHPHPPVSTSGVQPLERVTGYSCDRPWDTECGRDHLAGTQHARSGFRLGVSTLRLAASRADRRRSDEEAGRSDAGGVSEVRLGSGGHRLSSVSDW
jgi:hypothetical protein